MAKESMGCMVAGILIMAIFIGIIVVSFLTGGIGLIPAILLGGMGIGMIKKEMGW